MIGLSIARRGIAAAKPAGFSVARRRTHRLPDIPGEPAHYTRKEVIIGLCKFMAAWTVVAACSDAISLRYAKSKIQNQKQDQEEK